MEDLSKQSAKDNRSDQAKPAIGNCFSFIESWGRGIEKICTLCKNYGIPEPEYTVHARDIMLMFRSNVAADNNIDNSKNTDKVTDSSQKNTEEKDVNFSESIAENIVEKLSTMRGRIVKIVWKSPYASAQSISEEVGIAPRNVQEHLRHLQQQGIIRRVGPDKGGHWEIINQE